MGHVGFIDEINILRMNAAAVTLQFALQFLYSYNSPLSFLGQTNIYFTT